MSFRPLLASPAAPSVPPLHTDNSVVKLLQTAASLENLATTMYDAARKLPSVSGERDGPALDDVLAKAAALHTEHSRAFNEAAVRAGGTVQDRPNPRYAAVVQSTLAKMTAPLDAVKLAATIEDVTVQTYVKHVATVPTPQLRQLFAGAAGAGAQQLATLLVVQTLLTAGEALPPDPAELPATAAAAGVPHALFAVDRASPPDEGAA